jgi:hypothetical protein
MQNPPNQVQALLRNQLGGQKARRQAVGNAHSSATPKQLAVPALPPCVMRSYRNGARRAVTFRESAKAIAGSGAPGCDRLA